MYIPGQSDIPKARGLLIALCDWMRKDGAGHFADLIYRDILPLLHRSKIVRRAQSRRKSPNREVRRHIRDFAARHPDWNHDELAIHFMTTGGRISEALREKETPAQRRGKSRGENFRTPPKHETALLSRARSDSLPRE